MIQILADFPDDVLGISAVGKVTAADFRTVVLPALSDKRSRHQRVGFYYELGPKFRGMTIGAAWEDAKIDIANWRAWRHIALVSDVPWIVNYMRKIVQLFHHRVRFFNTDEADVAREWVLEGSSHSK